MRIGKLLASAAILCGGLAGLVSVSSAQTAPPAQTAKPNILVIFGDDVGLTNVSAYSMGLMGYRTPNIDSIARDGMIFTDYYAEQSCTAGRSTFITGEATLRTGLSKVGLPGADLGLRAQNITIAEALKPLGYATGQFGKNHLGDKDEFLPTAHGFDEFFGNLYHLNAEEEPENPDYPKDPAFRKKYGPRGVIKSSADGKIEDTGPLTIKRMETIDDETTNAAMDFMDRQVKAGKPFFTWMNTTRMHLYTHVRPEMLGKSGISEYFDGMLEHDGDVGKLLQKLKDLGVENNTIVIYSTDNGPHMNSWPDGAMTPFRGEKNTNWEGAYRVPAMVRWPGHIKPGVISTEIVSGLDWFPTLLAAAGDPDVTKRLLDGWSLNGRTYKVHLDGFNQLPLLTGQTDKSARDSFFYFNDDNQLVAVRYQNWKFNFCEQRVEGTLRVWQAQFDCGRLPTIINLRMDPFERAPITSNTYWDWSLRHSFLVVPVQALVAQFLSTFKDYPPAQKPASFSIDQITEQMMRQLPN
ncbi:arylsulfatase [Starkeya sp. ORNL1]|uniref:arylsulfatase n=1 Tax=Starkeya sp. ORNL1 TaxID=2709380 RepID=UPI001463D7CA|nr:arylsulfatase [Starkeya sp. ORNL1]QJP13086.1 arylsulfatase [Starkeya sp. ORNL1]